MKTKVLAVTGAVLGVPAAIFTTIQIIDNLSSKPAPDTIRVGAVTKFKLNGLKAPIINDKNLAARVSIACDGRRNCDYIHTFNNRYVTRIRINWNCLPSGHTKSETFSRHIPKPLRPNKPIHLILSCY